MCQTVVASSTATNLKCNNIITITSPLNLTYITETMTWIPENWSQWDIWRWSVERCAEFQLGTTNDKVGRWLSPAPLVHCELHRLHHNTACAATLSHCSLAYYCQIITIRLLSSIVVIRVKCIRVQINDINKLIYCTKFCHMNSNHITITSPTRYSQFGSVLQMIFFHFYVLSGTESRTRTRQSHAVAWWDYKHNDGICWGLHD